METAELKILNVLFEKLHLTDEERIDFTENFEKARENGLKSTMGEFERLFKENFHRLELKMEQNKSDIDLKFEQVNTKFEQFDRKLDKHKSDIDLRFEEFNRKFEEFSRKLEQNKSDIDSELKQNKSDMDLKLKDIELKLKDVELKIERTNTNSIRWFISLFVAVVLLILGLYFK